MLRLFSHNFLMCLALSLTSTSLYANLDLPDPTRPGSFVLQIATPVKSLAKEFTLNSVLVSSQRRVAIINDKSVEVGDEVNGATVRQIEKSQVVLVKQGANFTLSLADHDFKQRK